MTTSGQADPDAQAAWLRHYEEVARRRNDVGRQKPPPFTRLRRRDRAIAVMIAIVFVGGSVVLAALAL